MKLSFSGRLAALLLALAVCSASASAFDLKGLFGGGASADGDKKGGQLGDILGNIIGNAIADKDVDPSQLEGEWAYTGPAVDFASDNALQNIGGAAAGATIEKKLEPYYKKAGLTNLQFAADKEGNFTMQLKYGTLSGTIEKGEQGFLIFNFKAFNKINIGKISARATLAVDTLSLTFDVSGLIKIVKTASQLSGNSTISSMVKLLESYDGLYAGFKMKRSHQAAQ